MSLTFTFNVSITFTFSLSEIDFRSLWEVLFKPSILSVRLSNTNDLNYGILELYVENKWAAVCDEDFSQVTARVACRQLGYKDGRFQPGK